MREIDPTAANLLLYGDDFVDLRDSFSEDSFYPSPHCHRSARAAGTGTLQAQADIFIIVRSHKLDIPTMTLQGRPNNRVNHAFDLLLEGLLRVSLATTTFFTHKKSPKSTYITTLL
jgi:hypothetical protein